MREWFAVVVKLLLTKSVLLGVQTEEGELQCGCLHI